MTIKTTEVLNKLLENLSTAVDNTDFSIYFPNSRLSVPLREKYSATIGVKSESVALEGSQQSVFYIELLSPIDKNGEATFAKAVEISSELLAMDISGFQGCVIGDMEYISAQRAFKITITFTTENISDKDISVIKNDSLYSCALISERAFYTACDIKVYGQSKPIDTVLSAYEYILVIRANNTAELPQKGFEIKSSRYKYLGCIVQSEECGIGFTDYKIISKKRVKL